MTISLTVILIESTNEISYGLPIMITLMVLHEFFSLLMYYIVLYCIYEYLYRVAQFSK